MAGASSPARAIMYAFVANLGIAIAKLIAAIYTASGSMFAEAIHSFADSVNQVLLFIGLKGSQRPADEEHPMGYGKLSYFWSFVVALILFSLGGVYSIYEGLHKLMDPVLLTDIWIGLTVLGLAICLEGASFYGASIEAKKMAGERSLFEWLKQTRNAELVVVLGEDLAAMLGLSIAFAALFMVWLTNDPVYDAVGSISIGVLLVIVAVFLGVRLKSLLVGRSAEPDLCTVIYEKIDQDNRILEVFNMITLQMGPKIMLAAKVRMRAEMRVAEAVSAINELEASIKSAHPEVGWCFMEIDDKD
ncbi:MAG: cation diffusion facilitator family transporter [Gammaproteobacteria bacterium]|jgi:cation diffusion facilitator family transporter|nr:cation diffusion facilitator family transporter [Gammaproteobacteria bacterium]MBT5204731.1 cation diffusion facilitator family transporter [Gammaproteobacteria bacterium]MBT5601675.1 cation diffusion facilitator family transporter [Gammaproteobacteria bacterium]MBT6245262.1 cation diffusion facilitator family transporter [Gammaproteobacteria bacterium]